MREIKFKGKCLEPPTFYGKTVCGSLVTSPDGTERIFEHVCDQSFCYFSVDPKTVRQFTGFFDKNGNEIYEGDVLRSDEYPYSCIEDNERDNYFAVVYYCEEGACFATVTAKNLKSDVIGISDGIIDNVSQQKMKKFEIVGNIHDPEWKQYGAYFQSEETKD